MCRWWNDIGIPQQFSATFLLLGPTVIPLTTASGADKIFQRADPRTPMTGANLVWETQVTLMHGLFNDNASTVARCFKIIFDSAVVMPQPDEGIMQDGSFHQHGAELLAGSYGASFTSCNLELMCYASGTPFYMTTAQCDAFSTLVLDGQAWMIVAGSTILDWSVTGREISRQPGISHAPFLPDYLRNVTCARHEEFVDLANRMAAGGRSGVGVVFGHRHYYDSDYSVLFSGSDDEQWSVSLRMYSNRTVNARCINGEGFMDEHTADGVLNIYQDGTEFAEIPPVWDYMKLPGTVTRQYGPPPSCSTTSQHSPFEFVGGVSTGSLRSGTSAQQLVSRGLRQLRSWFFFNHAVLALATNLSLTEKSAPDVPIFLTMAAQALVGDVVVKITTSDTSSILPHGNHSFEPGQIEWILHNRLAYVCVPTPCGGAVTIVNEVVTGDWKSIGAGSGRVETALFSAMVDVPLQASGNIHPSPGYLVIPNSTVDTISISAASHANTTVVTDPNSLAVGAMNHPTSGPISMSAGGVFPTKGSLSFAPVMTASVDAPSLLQIVLFNNQSVAVAVSSPIATTVTVTLSISVVCTPVEYLFLKSNSGQDTQLHLDLASVAAGATVMVRCHPRQTQRP